MRPIGDYRAALRTAARELGPSGGTWHEMAQRAQLGREVARRTAENMRRGGELVVVGYERVQGTNRPATRLAAAELAGASARSTAALSTFATLARALSPAAMPASSSWLDFV